jgi:hypothetical protein
MKNGVAARKGINSALPFWRESRPHRAINDHHNDQAILQP